MLRSEWLPALGLGLGIGAAQEAWLTPKQAMGIYLASGVLAIFLGFLSLVRWIRRGTDEGFRFKEAFALMTAVCFVASSAAHRAEERLGRAPASASSVHLDVPKEDAFTWAQYAALEESWVIKRSDREDSSIDAYAISPVFKVRENFVIEIDQWRGGWGGAQITVRGRNSRLMRRYLDRLARRTPAT